MMLRKFGLVLSGLMASTSAQAKWVEAESAHFKVYADGSKKQLENAITRLEGVHYLLGIATGANATGRIVKVKVYYVADQSTVAKLYGIGGGDVAGFYNPASLGAYAVVPQSSGSQSGISAESVLFHEYTHHYMLQYMKGLFPGWFIEGFAELFSTASFEVKGAITFGKAAKHREFSLREGKWLPYEKIFDGSYRSMENIDVSTFYGQSWLAAHYLLLSGKRQGQLRQYMMAIQRGASMEKAMDAFGKINELSRDLRVYYDGASFPYKTPPLPASVSTGITYRDLRPAEVTLLNERIRVQYHTYVPELGDFEDTEKEAERKAQIAKRTQQRDTWLAALRSKAAALGNDPDGLELLADAECLSKNSSECSAAASKFLAIAPQSLRALNLMADALILQGKDLEKARSYLLQANKIDAGNPQVKVSYFNSFVKEGVAPPDDAMSGLYDAMQTMPQVDSIRLKLGQAFAGRGDKARAIAALSPLANAPHTSSSQKRAAALIKKLNEQ